MRPQRIPAAIVAGWRAFRADHAEGAAEAAATVSPLRSSQRTALADLGHAISRAWALIQLAIGSALTIGIAVFIVWVAAVALRPLRVDWDRAGHTFVVIVIVLIVGKWMDTTTRQLDSIIRELRGLQEALRRVSPRDH